jgi:hypothetical protein
MADDTDDVDETAKVDNELTQLIPPPLPLIPFEDATILEFSSSSSLLS